MSTKRSPTRPLHTNKSFFHAIQQNNQVSSSMIDLIETGYWRSSSLRVWSLCRKWSLPSVMDMSNLSSDHHLLTLQRSRITLIRFRCVDFRRTRRKIPPNRCSSANKTGKSSEDRASDGIWRRSTTCRRWMTLEFHRENQARRTSHQLRRFLTR